MERLHDAVLGGQDLGEPVRARENPAIGALRLPARPVFALARGTSPLCSDDACYLARSEAHSRRAAPSGPWHAFAEPLGRLGDMRLAKRRWPV